MTVYYVGAGGDNGNAGTSWGARKLTINGAEDIPVSAGDTVYVGPGTYREMLTCDVSGSAGSPITYIGDYTGANTDGAGGLVRITGSDNDQTAARASAITATSKNYRTFQGFAFDIGSAYIVNTGTAVTNWIIKNCYVANGLGAIQFAGTQSANQIDGCFILGAVLFTHTSVQNDCAHVVQNSIFAGNGVQSVRIGGITVKNTSFIGAQGSGVRVTTALDTGQLMTVRNSIFAFCNVGVRATATAEFDEDYNTFHGNATDRTTVNAGAHSIAYPPLFDPRWFFELVTNGAGPSSVTQMLSPFDLASFSQLVNLAGSSPTTTDLRGTSVQGAQRELGALEYDSTLKIEGAAVNPPGWL